MAKKKKKSLLPKRIAGVKVPKSVRKGRFGELLASKAGQALLAEAVMAAGALTAAKKAGDSDKVRTLADHAVNRLQNLGDGAKHKGKDVSVASGALAVALGEAARSFVDAFNRENRRPSALHEEDGDDEVWTSRAQDADGGSKKKPVSYEAGPL